MAETAEWQPAQTEQTPPPEEQESPPEEELRSEAMDSFIKETGDLFEQMRGKKPEEKPKIEEPATPQQQDSGFIPADEYEKLPPAARQRIDHLYGQVQENKRQWEDANKIMRTIREENEKLRSQVADTKLQQSAAELDSAQLEVIDLFTPNSPNYNPTLGAQKLRDLTTKDQALKAEREAEQKRSQEFTQSLEEEDRQRNIQETVEVIGSLESSRAYAREGHPLYPQVVAALRHGMETAPEWVTAQQVVDRVRQHFDSVLQNQQSGQSQPSQGNGQARAAAPGQGERLTVSQVIGTQQRGPGRVANPAEQLSQREREVARKLFMNPEGGINESKAYQMYLEGKK